MRTDRYRSDARVAANVVTRRPIHLLLLVWVLPILASACIVVVEEDDRDRHRHLYGSEWTLEVVFYRTQTLDAADRDMTIQFADNGVLTGEASCGSFSGRYSINDNDGLSVSSMDVPGSCGGDQATQFMTSSLRSARSFEVDERSLRIRTAEDGYLSFSTDG